MENSQLVKLLKTFDKKDIRDSRKWLQSPFHNQRDDVLILFDYLCKGDHLFNEKKLLKERVFSIVNPSEKFDDAKFRQSMHFLLKSLEEFLVYQDLQKQQVENSVGLIRIYRERNLEKLWNKTVKYSTKLCKDSPYRDVDYHRNIYLIAKEEYEFAEVQKRINAQKKLRELINAFVKFYLSEEVILLCLDLFIPNSSKENYELEFNASILKYIEKSGLLEYPSIDIYYSIYKVITEKKEETFDHLKDKIRLFGHLFKNEERREIYLFIINHCIRQVNAGNKKYLREAFNFYKSGIEANLFIENELIDRFMFRNIISTGVSLKEFEWVKNFIYNYKDKLPEKYKDSFTNFGLGLLYFKSHAYKKAMSFLAQYEHDDIMLNLNSKVMLIKMYYELDEINALESLLESSKVYLRRKKGISDSLRALYNNIINYTKKLLRVNPYDKEKRAKLRAEIEAANPLIEKQWFLDQLEKL